MADPLSFAASIIAVATLAANITAALSKLRAVNDLPGRLHAINNEVADLEVVLRQVGSVATKRHALPEGVGQVALSDILHRAEAKLRELDAIVQRLIQSCVGTAKFVVRAKAWWTEKPKLEALQEELHTIKATLNIMLGATHSQDMMRVQLDLQTISLASTQMQTVFRDDMSQALEQSHQRVDERLDALEKLLYDQFSRLQTNLDSEMGQGFVPSTARASKQTSDRTTRAVQLYKKPNRFPSAQGISIRTTQYTNLVCEPQCPCSCHQRLQLSSPGLVGHVLGHLFLGYVGLLRIRHRCDNAQCTRSRARTISIEYWFPLCGNIDGIKVLFMQGLASPHDVSQSRNFSMLRWAVFDRQYNTCKFLLEAGSDPNQAGASGMMWDFVLWATLDDSEQEQVKDLLAGSDFIDEQKFPQVHKIVLQLSLRSLEEELLSNPFAVFETDARGRTALFWAAARGDERSTVTLLGRGADPNATDHDGRVPLHLAAESGRAGSIRLLLEAGAHTDPASPKRTPPLVLIGQHGDIITLKTMLDFNPNIEARSPDGETALLAVARRQTAAHALLLLEHNANPNAAMNDGKTPLTAAITYNNGGILQVLLDRWNRYITCPRLAGPNLLNIVADYADVETIRILSAAEHLRLRRDKQYALAADSAERMRKRPNVSDELIAAFDDLLAMITRDDADDDKDSLLESGLLRRDTDSSGDEALFMDAHEYIDIEK
ncbi:ankyrin repeat-containing protein-like protein [Hypoxylon crocopeplum]|nr:ankyrin repeat-containing protein-like protein [Hypoxylon crocopeplum]